MFISILPWIILTLRKQKLPLENETNVLAKPEWRENDELIPNLHLKFTFARYGKYFHLRGNNISCRCAGSKILLPSFLLPFKADLIWSHRTSGYWMPRSLEHAPILLPVAALTAAAAVTDGQETLYSYHPLLIGGRGALGLAIYFPLQRKVQFHELGKVQIELQQLSFSAWGHFASMTEHQELTQLLFFAT